MTPETDKKLNISFKLVKRICTIITEQKQEELKETFIHKAFLFGIITNGIIQAKEMDISGYKKTEFERTKNVLPSLSIFNLKITEIFYQKPQNLSNVICKCENMKNPRETKNSQKQKAV